MPHTHSERHDSKQEAACASAGAPPESGREVDLTPLAEALAALVASWWRARQAGNEEAAVGKTAAEEVRDDAARPSP